MKKKKEEKKLLFDTQTLYKRKNSGRCGIKLYYQNNFNIMVSLENISSNNILNWLILDSVKWLQKHGFNMNQDLQNQIIICIYIIAFFDFGK